ncbi:hypothetical protein I3760_12G023800 [Carya illinoinensis]|nr:hypothetical protein I3760_12G023800 [Carya illinoinensis]
MTRGGIGLCRSGPKSVPDVFSKQNILSEVLGGCPPNTEGTPTSVGGVCTGGMTRGGVGLRRSWPELTDAEISACLSARCGESGGHARGLALPGPGLLARDRDSEPRTPGLETC